MRDILLTMDDGTKHLAHHGVLGMKWGVWNDETKRKYGLHAKGGKAKIQGPLPKGTELYRITNRQEADNFNPHRSIYATTNEDDFNKYAKLSRFLPSLRNEQEASVLTMKLKDDASYADGETAVKVALEKALKKDASKFSKTLKKTSKPETVASYDYWLKDYTKKYGKETMQKVLDTSLADVDERKAQLAGVLIHLAVSGAIGSYAHPRYRDEYVEKLKKRGYDVAVDPEDWTNREQPIIRDVKHPVIVLDPAKSIDLEYHVGNTTVDKLVKQGIEYDSKKSKR